jgi:fibronectin-binding autotransporter adhesin
VTGPQIQFDTRAGDDRLTINMNGGDLLKTVTYDGGPNGATGDKLSTIGGSFGTVTHNLTGPNAGNFALAGTGVQYTNVEPVVTIGSAATGLVFNLSPNATDAILGDFGAAGDGVSQLRFTANSLMDIIFPNPSGSLTINAAGGSLIELRTMDAGFNPGAMTFSGLATDVFRLINAGALPDATAITIDVSAGDGAATLDMNNITETIGSLAGQGNLSLGSGTLTTGGNGGTTTFSGLITGSGGITKVGAGTQSIQGSGTTNNTVSGLLLVNGGQVDLGTGFTGDGAWKGNATINSGATLRLTQGNIIANGSDFTINTGGTLNMNGQTDVIGNIAGGGNITNNSNGTGVVLDDLGVNAIFSGNITGGGGLFLRSTLTNGSQTLSGTVSFGTVKVASKSATENTTLVLNGAMATIVSYSIGENANGNRQGHVNQTGGSIVTVSGAFRLGHWPNGVSTYIFDSGSLSLTGTPSGVVNPGGVGEQNGVIYLGVDGTGTFTQTGGDVSAHGVVLDARSNTTGTDTLTLNGGTLTLGASGIKTGNLDANTTIQVNLGGGTLRASANWSSTRPMTLTNAVLATLDAAGGNLVLAGTTVVNVSGATRIGVSPGSQTGIPGTQPGSGTLTVQDTAALTSDHMRFGENNAPNVPGMTAVLNQTGGTVTTTGNSGENAAIRLGHWPNETSTYNLSGGVLQIQGAGNDLAIGTDGTGIFNQTGGEASSDGVAVNHRNTNGAATFTVSGGTYTVGARGIFTAGGPAAVNVGGSGGTIKAGASFSSSLGMTLSGSGANAATFDSNGNSITLSGALGGAGGLNKNGVGSLTLSASNNYSGDTAVNAGTLLVTGSTAAGSAVAVNNTAILAGNGTVGGTVNVANGATLAPGLTAGTTTAIFNVGNSQPNTLAFVSGANFNVELKGLTAGSQSAQRSDRRLGVRLRRLRHDSRRHRSSRQRRYAGRLRRHVCRSSECEQVARPDPDRNQLDDSRRDVGRRHRRGDAVAKYIVSDDRREFAIRFDSDFGSQPDAHDH